MFQSTHSLRSATTMNADKTYNVRVSIHALLAECDKIMINYIHQREGFNPRTPCGVRQDTSGGAWSTMSFNPRTPCGVRQEAIRHLGLTEDVSIHALLAECDSPGSSAGGAGTVSIHALLAECDKDFYESILLMCSFNPRTPCGVRPSSWRRAISCMCFNPRTPCGVRRKEETIQRFLPLFQSTHSLRSATDKG